MARAKERLDKLIVQRRLASSRERARALILAGAVHVEGYPHHLKAGTMIDQNAYIRLVRNPIPYVSRGGVKLAEALDYFSIDPHDKIAMDVGASTGGFTDCLLQRGARKVYAVDVGYGQLAWRLQKDSRVVNLQRRNIRHLQWEEVGEEVDLVVIDTSFISLKLVIPPSITFLKLGGELLALIKPQFEVGKGEVGKGGVVRDPTLHRRVVDEITHFTTTQGITPRGVLESSLRGPKGNREFFFYGVLSEKKPMCC